MNIRFSSHNLLRSTAQLFAPLLLLPLSAAAQVTEDPDTDSTNGTTSSSASISVFDIGGEKFGGGGDKKKPRCQISHPLSAGSPFFIEWNCEDDTSTRGELVSEIWILRPNAPRYVKVSDYLGFPASLQVDEELLGGPFSRGLPASFVLIARDTAGNAAMSAPFTITNRNNDVDSCTLTAETRPTVSNGNTTGRPTLTAILSQISTFTQSSSNTSFVVSMFTPEVAVPCDIDDLCREGDKEDELFFTAAITVDAEGVATARLNLSPGGFAVTLEGTGRVSAELLESVNVTGTTVIDNTITDLTLSCSRG